jgi:hypothetical protein
MQLKICSKIILLLFAFVLALMLTIVSAKADFTFGEPVNLESVIPAIDPAYDFINCLSYDGLEMYIVSGQGHDTNLRVLRRESEDEDWGPPEDLGPVVNTADDSGSSISADGLALYFNSNRAGGQGSWDIYMTTRTTKNDPWGPPVNLGPKVNSPYSEAWPWISADGLEIYFHSWRPGGYGNADIYVTRRPTQNDPWADAVNLGSVVNSSYNEYGPCLSPDGLLLFLDTPAGGSYGYSDIRVTRRATKNDPWGVLVNLGPKVNGPADDYAPHISPDGSTLYFQTELAGTFDNWQASIIPIVDFNGDGIVNLKDFSRLAQYWGQDEPSVDIGPMSWGDGRVDIQDLAVFAEYWLSGF